MAEPSGTRALLTAKIATEIRQQTGKPLAEATDQAGDIAEKKHRETWASLRFACLMFGAAAFADHKGAPTWVTLGVAGVGLYVAGVGADGEYFKAMGDNLADNITKVRKALGLGGA